MHPGLRRLARRAASRAGLTYQPARYPNFGWVVSWVPTYYCNSSCEYCAQSHEREQEHLLEGLERVISFHPRYVNVTGGEIFLLPQMEHCLRTLRERCPEAVIYAGTNLQAPLDRVERSLPYLDVLMLSVDSHGPHNRIHRCIDGDVAMRRAARLHALGQAQRRPVNVHTNSVVSTENYLHLDQFVRRLQAMAPGMGMGLTTVMPPSHPLSLARDPDKARATTATFRRLRDEGMPVWFPDLDYVTTDPKAAVSRDTLLERVHCRRQFFRVEVIPDGSVVACKPARYLEHYGDWLWQALRGGAARDAWQLTRELAHCLVAAPGDAMCPFPCNCEHFVEGLFYPEETPNQGWALQVFGRKIEAAELEHADGFLRRTFGHGFPPRVLAALRRP